MQQKKRIDILRKIFTTISSNSVRMHSKICLLIFLLAAAYPVSAALAQSDNPRFTILHTNDEHSTLLPLPMADYHPEQPNPAVGGFARLATKVNQIREEKKENGEPVLLFSGGDILGGTPFAWLILDEYAPEIKLMQKVGYDAMVVGNHEFDYGPEVFAEYLKKAGYPENHEKMAVISSNIQIPDGHALHDAEIKRTRMIELENGLKVGVFGLLGKNAVSVAPLAEPVSFAEQHETARKFVQELQDQGADIIVAVTHSGVPEDVALAEDVSGIDLIVGGHDHRALYEPVIAGNTIIVQAGYYLKYLGRIDLEYDREAGRLKILNEENGIPYLNPLDDSVEEDPEVLEIIDAYTESLNRYIYELTDGGFDDIGEYVVFADAVLNREPPLKESQVGNFATDAMRIISEQVTGRRVDFAFQGNGVLRADITPGTMPWSEGGIPFQDLATIAGLGTGPDLTPGYPIVSIYLTGEEVYRVLEISALLSQFLGNTHFLQVSGLRFEYDPSRSILFRIPFTGTPIPTNRAVFKVELFEGEGMQRGDEFREIKKDDQLYHVISDYYVASFLPMIGELLPSLELVLKDADGNPIDHIDDAVVHHNGRELKVWQTLAEYAASLPEVDGKPIIPEYYAETGDRIIERRGFPLIVWPILALVVLLGLIFWIFRKIRRRRNR